MHTNNLHIRTRTYQSPDICTTSIVCSLPSEHSAFSSPPPWCSIGRKLLTLNAENIINVINMIMRGSI